MLLRKEFTFDAAHNLVSYHGKCERLHGHTYRMAVEITGQPDGEGMIVDFAKVKEAVDAEVISEFDHAYLNDVMPQPSAENIARHAFERLDPVLRGPNYELTAVHVWETPDSSVVFSREDLRCAYGSGAE
ncbi:MAG: 6-carboxytetrahydropterin synthase QueD [Synergistaceae bacterium]|nr:6-carboxytetrahydropterin synthase QueD [Synergistaceae bacterium]